MTQLSKWHIVNKRSIAAFLVLAVVILTSMTPTSFETHKIQRIVLDAGHGGSDPGNLGTGRYKSTEKDITLEVTLALGREIKEKYPDIEIVYTRIDDSYPTLNDRVEIANENKADLFISIHCDAFTKEKARGSGTFVMGMHKTDESLRVAMQENASIYKEENFEENYGGFDPKDPDTYIALTIRQNAYLDQSLQLSRNIQDQFKSEGRVDRGVKQAGFYVICFTTMPSTLVELGFLTNKEEEDFLNSDAGKVKMTQAIFRGFEKYKNGVEGVVTEVVSTTPKPTEDESASSETADVNTIITNKVKKGISLEVQILSSATPLQKGAAELKGLKDFEEYKINGVYKYTAGKTTDYKEAQHNQKVLKELGFSGAFIVAIQDGERMDLREALNQIN